MPLRNPIALRASDLRVVRIGDSDPTEAYLCPGCGEPLSPRCLKSERIVAHWAHRAGAQCSKPETALHQAAKHLVAQVVNDWQAGASAAPTVRCETRCGHQGVWQDLPGGRVASAIVEQPKGPWIVDVGLLDGRGVLQAAIEIFVTHRVPPEKVQGLRDADVPMVELDAEQVVNDPLRWRPLGDLKATAADCQECVDLAEVLRLISRLTGQLVATHPYITSAVRCFRCKHPTLVYTWDGHRPYAGPDELPSSLDEKPRTLKLICPGDSANMQQRLRDHKARAPRGRRWARRRQKEILQEFEEWLDREHWANHCGQCNVVLGDRYLFEKVRVRSKYEGPFATPRKQAQKLRSQVLALTRRR